MNFFCLTQLCVTGHFLEAFMLITFDAINIQGLSWAHFDPHFVLDKTKQLIMLKNQSIDEIYDKLWWQEKNEKNHWTNWFCTHTDVTTLFLNIFRRGKKYIVLQTFLYQNGSFMYTKTSLESQYLQKQRCQKVTGPNFKPFLGKISNLNQNNSLNCFCMQFFGAGIRSYIPFGIFEHSNSSRTPISCLNFCINHHLTKNRVILNLAFII